MRKQKAFEKTLPCPFFLEPAICNSCFMLLLIVVLVIGICKYKIGTFPFPYLLLMGFFLPQVLVAIKNLKNIIKKWKGVSWTSRGGLVC